MESNLTPQKLWNLGFICFALVNFIISAAFSMAMPIIAGYIVNMGATLAFAGFITGLMAFVSLFTRPFASLLGDRLNKKKLLIVSTFATGVIMVFYAFVPGIMWLVPTRILHGIFFSVSGTLAFALGTYYIPGKRMAEGVGFLGVGQVIGRAVGPNTGIYLSENYSYELCFIISGIILVTAGLSIIAIRYEHSVSKTPGTADGKSSASFKFNDLIAVELLPNAFFAGLLVLGGGLANSYLVLLGAHRSISNIGLFFVVNALVTLAARPILGKLADRKGIAYTIIPGFILISMSMLVIAFSQSLWPLLFSAVLLAIGGGALPALQSECLRMLSPERKTLATGTYFIGLDTCIGLGTIIGGASIDYLGFGFTFGSVSFLMLAGLGIYLRHSRPVRL